MLSEKELKNLRDLFVKLSNVFVNQIYIFPTGYVVASPIDRLESTIIFVKLEQKYEDLIIDAYFSKGEKGILHITNISEIKNDLFNNINYITDEELLNSEFEDLDNTLKLYNDQEWKEFRLSNDDAENEQLCFNLFKNNEAYEFKPDDEQYIIISKTLFPLVSEKNYKGNLFFSIVNKNEQIDNILFDFHFTHFRLYSTYTYVKMV